MASEHICIGVISGPYGVRGAVRIKSFTADPVDVAAYGDVSDESGKRHFTLTVTGTAKGAVRALIKGINDRDAAEALKGVKLFVPRTVLPVLAEEEYYYCDLVGLDAVLADGTPLGVIKAVQNYGAGDMIEIEEKGGNAIIIPFTRDAVPEVDFAGSRIVVTPPEELEGEAEPPEGEENG